MKSKVTPIPPGYHTVTPYLTIKNAAEALEFYKAAFNAKEVMRMAESNGKVGHAEIQIGDSRIMISDEYPEWGALAPQTVGGSSTSLMLYVEDVDRLFAQAIQAGGKELMAVSDQFYGDRCGKLEDPFGHKWMIATHVEEVPPDELNERAKAAFGMSVA